MSRTFWRRLLGTVLVLAGVAVGPPWPAQRALAEPAGAPLVGAVERVELVVKDLARSRAFFELLGFSGVRQQSLSGASVERSFGVKGARLERLELALGSERIALLQYSAPSEGRPMPRDTRGNDLWFQHLAIVVSDMNAAYSWLHAHHVAQVSTTPQKLPSWNRAAGGIEAFYFVDPDGHNLELIHFPKGKGDQRWQLSPRCTRTPRELCAFLGIDHTAIAVEDTEQSLLYYRDGLGLRVAGASENYGTEQEHLNGVFGAHLRITALRAAKGPGIELLEYLAPRGGRPLPSDARPNDIAHFQVVVRASNTNAVRSATVRGGGHDVALDAETRQALVRDRDGHALFVHETADP
jgi:catechol 2,3-dioxygenase-like lactoylglutathione lyase family enzyme